MAMHPQGVMPVQMVQGHPQMMMNTHQPPPYGMPPSPQMAAPGEKHPRSPAPPLLPFQFPLCRSPPFQSPCPAVK